MEEFRGCDSNGRAATVASPLAASSHNHDYNGHHPGFSSHHHHRHHHHHRQQQPRPAAPSLRSSRSAAQIRPSYDEHSAPPLPHRIPSPYQTDDDLPPPYDALPPRTITTTTTTTRPRTAEASKWKTALIEAQFLAGGLIAHPSESTKHYTIIRHSHGLVWYKGPGTSISITILATERLAPNRTLWLQEKGYSGNTGMSLKALVGARGSWIDVTPAQEAQVHHIPEKEERCIQRDIGRFVSKASGRTKKPIPRETHVVRIPATARDGYFRLVLCVGDDAKIMCGSPVFRIASTTVDGAVVRGASLSTMPIEMGVKMASTVGTQVVKKYTGVAGAVVHSKAGTMAVKTSVRKVATMAYRSAAGGELQTAVQDSWRRNRLDRHGRLIDETSMMPAVRVIGSDHGPEPPFPVKFSGRGSRADSPAGFDIPTLNLDQVPDHVKARLSGVYAAWVSLRNTQEEWHAAVVTIAPLRTAQPSVFVTNSVTLSLATDDAPLPNGQLDILLMGYLHAAADAASPIDHLIFQHQQDVTVTICSLAREPWSAPSTLSRLRALSSRSVDDRLNAMTGRVQQTVDRIPLHKVGVRSDAAAARDQLIGVGGLWIRRDG